MGRNVLRMVLRAVLRDLGGGRCTHRRTDVALGGVWRLVTFTYQANLLAAVYYAWTLVSPRADARIGLRGAVVLYVVVAGVIWNLFLTGHSMGYTVGKPLAARGRASAGDRRLAVRRHEAPCRSAGGSPSCGSRIRRPTGSWRSSVLNRVGRRAPYYFLDPGSVGVAAVAANVSLLAVGFLGLGYLLVALARVRSANT